MSIEYLLRTDDNNPGLPIEEPLPDVNSIEFMRENTTLKGTDFQYDNQSLYTILRHYLSSTPGWNVISKYANQNDGRKAYKSLRSHYERLVGKHTNLLEAIMRELLTSIS